MRGDKVIAVAKTGSYEGIMHDKTICFKGIEYGEIPGRWQKSIMVSDSAELFHAHDFGPSALQEEYPDDMASQNAQSEDCLSLNIWTRNLTGKKPVLVFIHAGGTCSGGSADPLYNGYYVVNENDGVVMVTMNYRLSFLGSLYLEDIGGQKYADSGNLQILDVKLALQWIKENISAFGGDSDNIAIMGQSAGSANVHLLGVMPGAEGLFNKLMIDSTAPTSSTKSVEEAVSIRNQFMKSAGCTSLEQLLALSSDEIKTFSNKFEKDCEGGSELKDRAKYYCPVRDGKVIPFDVYGAYKNGAAKGCKMLIGLTNGEHDNHCPEALSLDEAVDFLDKFSIGFISGTCREDRMAALKEYFDRDDDKLLRSMDLGSDAAFWDGSIRIAAAQAQYNQVYMWRFCWAPVNAVRKSKYGRALHCTELPFVFGKVNAGAYADVLGWDIPEELYRQTQAAFINFVKTGNPNGGGVPLNWPLYEEGNRSTMFIDEEWKVIDDPKREDRLTMEKIFVK